MLHVDEESCTSDFSSSDKFNIKGGYLENSIEVDHNQAGEFSDLELENEDDHPTSSHHQE